MERAGSEALKGALVVLPAVPRFGTCLSDSSIYRLGSAPKAHAATTYSAVGNHGSEPGQPTSIAASRSGSTRR